MEIVVRATVVFFFILVLTRGMKKRALADMAPFEMILLIVIGDIVQQGVTQEDMSLTGAVLAGSTFTFWISVLSYASWRSKRVSRLLEGVPLVVVQDGEPVDAALTVERLPVEEILEEARLQGIESLSQVKLAVLEPSGKMSFIRNDG